MSFTGRIRLFLVGVALLPPLLMMVVVYFYSVNQAEISYREHAAEDLRKLADYRQQFRSRLAASLKRIVDHSWFDRSVRLAERGRSSQIAFDDLQAFGLDFYELLDPNGQVVGSFHRPGLIGEVVSHDSGQTIDGVPLYETVEYDVDGHHAALAGVAGDTAGFSLYGGFYIGHSFKPTADQIIRGQLLIHFVEEENANGTRFTDMAFGSLYRYDGRLEAVLFGGEGSGFVAVADFEPADQSAVFSSFIDVISLVALVAVLAAVALGMYFSHRARKEFDNLIDAFGRVAAGDLSTAVMAYTEGEFSNLADSFSEMTQKLRRSQTQLATTEKIAAWQAMARKIAHEIKNPLTPIGIGAEDLRRSYQEHLPEFEQTLDQNTRMIKNEINRLTKLLDEFVSFARMKPPEITNVRLDDLCAELKSLYGEAVASNRLTISNRAALATVRLDPELIKQLLVNLVKNGLESKDASTVSLRFDDGATAVKMTVVDDGPGFSEEVLNRQFEPYLSTKKEGSGLGLVICQRIVHDHGGSIELNNRAEGGAEVTVVLPQD